jgi:hypothetical protein
MRALTRVKAVRFVTRLGQKELLEFTEDEQKGSWGGEPSEVQRKKMRGFIDAPAELFLAAPGVDRGECAG